jgi:integrase/recombinase XerD
LTLLCPPGANAGKTHPAGISRRTEADSGRHRQHYLARIRTRFPQAGTHRALWAGWKGRGLGGQAIYDTIAARTRAAFGHVVNPHLFRDCAATTIAIAQPGQIGVARDLLGHASLHTTNTYYNQARSIEVSRLYSTVLSASRTKATANSKL